MVELNTINNNLIAYHLDLAIKKLQKLDTQIGISNNTNLVTANALINWLKYYKLILESSAADLQQILHIKNKIYPFAERLSSRTVDEDYTIDKLISDAYTDACQIDGVSDLTIVSSVRLSALDNIMSRLKALEDGPGDIVLNQINSKITEKEEMIHSRLSELVTKADELTGKIALSFERAKNYVQDLGYTADALGKALVGNEHKDVRGKERTLTYVWITISFLAFVTAFLVSMTLYSMDRCLEFRPFGADIPAAIFAGKHVDVEVTKNANKEEIKVAATCTPIEPNLYTIASRSIATLALLIVGIYAAIMSERHRRAVVYHRQFLVESRALPLYLATLPEEHQHRIREALAYKYFGQLNQGTQADSKAPGEDSLMKVIEILSSNSNH